MCRKKHIVLKIIQLGLKMKVSVCRKSVSVLKHLSQKLCKKMRLLIFSGLFSSFKKAGEVVKEGISRN